MSAWRGRNLGLRRKEPRRRRWMWMIMSPSTVMAPRPARSAPGNLAAPLTCSAVVEQLRQDA